MINRKLKVTIEKMIDKREEQIMFMEQYKEDRDFMIWEIAGDFLYDVTISYDPDYYEYRVNEECRK